MARYRLRLQREIENPKEGQFPWKYIKGMVFEQNEADKAFSTLKALVGRPIRKASSKKEKKAATPKS